MLFNSYSFLLFLPIVFAGYWLLARKREWQNVFVVAASYFFYGYWDWRFLSLIALTTLSSWVAGRLMDGQNASCMMRRTVNILNIVLNVGILCVFKYLNFFAESFASLLHVIGFQADMPTLRIILPVGISFYTFQAIGYSIDVYRRKIAATNNLVAFAAYISFFPQLVAGPIERATNLLPQFLQRRQFSYEQAVDGCRQMLWGFFKKVVVADNCAITVNMVWGDYASYSSTMLVVTAFLFSMQIYCDFSGYSDIAIGTAKLFGIRLSTNFRTPYFSQSIPDFWRRWHISLMTWFRDYIYIPLGGSREGRAKTIRNTFIVFFISGLWHGANYTFIVWGLFHALLFLPYFIRKQRSSTTSSSLSPFSIITTFALVTVGWIVFRAPTIADATGFITDIFTSSWTLSDVSGYKPMMVAVVCLIVEWLQRSREHALDMNHGRLFRFAPVRWLVYYALLFSLNALSAQQESFIYFQF